MWAIAALLFFFQAADLATTGTQALAEKRYEAAIDAFTRALAADPADYYSRFNLALAYSALGRDADALAAYRKVLETKPRLYEAELNAGILLLRQSNAAEALPLLEDANRQRPDQPSLLPYLARARLDTGAYEAAEESSRRLLALDGRSAEAALGLGRALARQGKLEEAEPFYRKAGELDAARHDLLLELAALYDGANNPERTIALLREFPDNATASRRLSELLVETSKYAEAATRLESVYAKDPTLANAEQLALAYLANHQPDSARPLLERVIAARPEDFELRMSYARLLRDKRQFGPAAAQFEAAARLRPNDVQPWTDLGAVLHLNGNLAGAFQSVDRAMALGANGAGIWFERAVLLDKLRQLPASIEAYKRFLSLSTGQNPIQEFQARQRARILERELARK